MLFYSYVIIFFKEEFWKNIPWYHFNTINLWEITNEIYMVSVLLIDFRSKFVSNEKAIARYHCLIIYLLGKENIAAFKRNSATITASIGVFCGFA